MVPDSEHHQFSEEEVKLLVRLDERFKSMMREQKQFREEMKQVIAHLEESHSKKITELETEIRSIKSLVMLARNGFVVLVLLGALVSWVLTTWNSIVRFLPGGGNG